MKTYGVDYFRKARMGLFTHYTYATYAEDKGTNWGGTWYSQDDPRGAGSPEEAARMLDGEKFARAAYDLGAEYVVFTLAHAGFNLLFPSETMKKTGCTHKCTQSSDAVAKLIAALAPYGIPLVLYIPPNDSHDIPDPDLKKMGWTDDRARMEFLKTLISEIFARYGDSVAGFWFDQCGPTADVRDHVKQCNPHAAVFVNTGITGNEEIHPLSDFIVSEYYGSIESCDSDTLPTHYSQVNRQIGKWWASGGKAPTDARNLYRYSVRTIATRSQFNGGIAWSCGPYIDQTWESGVRDLLSRIGDLVRAHEGFYHTVPGVSYPTAPNALLEKTHWGVSTESADGKTVYLHVLNLPADGVLKIGLPADGKVFSRAFCRDMALPLTRTAAGYTLLLPADCDPVDTVVRLVCE